MNHLPDIPHPLAADQLRAICAQLHGDKPHGALAYVATRLGLPYRTFHNYATGARPVPRHVTHALRTLCALQQITKGIPQ